MDLQKKSDITDKYRFNRTECGILLESCEGQVQTMEGVHEEMMSLFMWLERHGPVTAIFVLNFCPIQFSPRTKYGSQNLSGRKFFGCHILSYSAKTCPN